MKNLMKEWSNELVIEWILTNGLINNCIIEHKNQNNK